MKAKSMLCLSVLAVAVVSICVLTVTAQPFNSWPAEYTGATCGTTECSDCVGAFKDVAVGCSSGYRCYVVEDADTLEFEVCKWSGDSEDECNPWAGDEQGSASCEDGDAFWCECLPSGGNQNCDFSAEGCNCTGLRDFTSTVTAGSSCVEPT